MEKGKVKQFSEMTVEELKAEALGSYQAVYVNDCYGTSDVRSLEGAIHHLEKRGYAVRTISRLQISDEPVPQDEEKEEDANAPCIECGRTDKFLYPNMRCTECYSPDEDEEDENAPCLPEKSICNNCSEIDGCEAWDAEPQTDEDHVTWCSGFSDKEAV